MNNLRVVTFLVIAISALWLAATLVSFAKTNNVVFGQNKEEICQNNKARLAELEKQADELVWDLSFGESDEELFRNSLEDYNNALANPERRETMFRQKGWKNSIDARRRFFDEEKLQWKDVYARDDLLMLRALRDDDARWVDRIVYARAHKAEIAQKKADVDRQIAFHKNRLTELRCGKLQALEGCDALPGTWTWSWGSGNVTKGERETTITSDHTMSQPGNDGTWACSAGSVTFNWSHSKDTLTIVDKDTLQGGSNYGDWVRAKRR